MTCFAQMPGGGGPPPPAPPTLNPLTDPALADALTGAVQLVVPEAVLLGSACVLFVLGLFVRGRVVPWAAAVIALVGAGAAAVLVQPQEAAAYADLAKLVLSPIDAGPGAVFVRWLALGAGLLFVLMAAKEAVADIAADYYACVLTLVAGVSLAGRANDLVSVYLALELVSIPTYVLLYLPAKSRAAQEAAVKYFLLSILSSAVLLFGFSYLYGLAGSTNLTAVARTLAEGHKSGPLPMATLAAVLTVAGLAFKITAAPFHFYAPDVYQGGPTGVVAQLAVAPKVAGFVVLARVLGLLTPPLADQPFPAATQVPLVLWVLAAVSMTVGNILALLQDDLRRLLAYSGVAHTGYMLIGLVAATSYAPESIKLDPAYFSGADAVLFYLVGYTLMTVGVFAVLAYLHADSRPVETVDDLAGAGQSHPVAALLLAVLFLSLIGLPLTAGFSGKLLLFVAAFKAPAAGGLGNLYKILVVVAAVNAAVGAVYYLRVLAAMYLRNPLRPAEKGSGFGPLAAAVVCVLLTLAVGAYPRPLAEAARAAAPGKVAKAGE